MGLTLNSNSLTLEAAAAAGGAAASTGLTTAEVNTLIDAKTEWTFIKSLPVADASIVSFEDIFDDTYTTVKAVGDDLDGNWWMHLRLRTAQGLETSNYGYSYNQGSSTSGGYRGGAASYVPFMHDTGRDHAKNFEIVLSGLNAARKTTGRFHSGHGTSSWDGSYTVGGFVYSATRAVTGLQFQSNANMSSGTIKIYGLN